MMRRALIAAVAVALVGGALPVAARAQEYGFAYGVAVQRDNKVVIAGQDYSPTDPQARPSQLALARYDAFGRPDPQFGSGGHLRTDLPGRDDVGNGGRSNPLGILVQPDQRIVVVTSATSPADRQPGYAIIRYLPNGQLDGSFGNGGIATVRLPVPAYASALVRQPDGKYVVGGSLDPYNTGTGTDNLRGDFGLVRFTSDGHIDRTFGQDGLATTDLDNQLGGLHGLALGPTGTIVAVGTNDWLDQGGGGGSVYVARYSRDGQADGGFGTAGLARFDVGPSDPSAGAGGDQPRAVLVQADGKVLVTGYALGTPLSRRDGFVARLSSDGGLDPSFGSGGVTYTGSSAATAGGTRPAFFEPNAMQWGPNGTILVGGTAALPMHSNGHYGFAAMRLTPDGAADPSFGEGGRAFVDFSDTTSDTLAYGNAMATDADGGLAIAGFCGISEDPSVCSGSDRSFRFALARLTPSGATRCFGDFGRVTDDFVTGMGLGNGGPTGGCSSTPPPSPPPPPPPHPPEQGRPFKFVAVGDSVTAGFGFTPEGAPIGGSTGLDLRQAVGCIKVWAQLSPPSACGVGVLHRCVIAPTVSRFSCQSPDATAYPAQYARLAGLGANEFRNAAVWGSTPGDWLGKGDWSGRLRSVLADKPTLTVLTLGANPILSDFVVPTNPGNKCFHSTNYLPRATYMCIRDEGRVSPSQRAPAGGFTNRLERTRQQLTDIYTRLLDLPGNHVVVFHYHETVPLTLLLPLDLPAWEWLKAAVYPSGWFRQVEADNAARTRYLLRIINETIDAAVWNAQRSRPKAAGRIRILDASPGNNFGAHRCGSALPWVLGSDLCIHPTAEGHSVFAHALLRAYPDPRGLQNGP